jgi:TetR/AcrR family transcriptional regulator, tetracycline repressor protein
VAKSGRVAPVLSYGDLDRAHLTKHLMALAQRVGVDKVTMRTLAAEAGTSASSVYYHVKDKNEMLDLLIESIVDSIEIPSRGEWELRLVTLYTNAWDVLVAVPGSAALLQQRPHTRAAANMDEATRKLLHESGLATDDFDGAHAVLYIHLLGSVELAHRRYPGGATAKQNAGMKSVFLFGVQVILEGLRQMSAVKRPDRRAR